MFASYRRAVQHFAAVLAALFICVQGYARAAEQGGADLEKTISLDLGNEVKMDFVLIPAGSFVMGDDNGSMDQRPAHKVNITKPFYMSKHLVTQAQWEAVLGARRGRFGGGPPPAGEPKAPTADTKSPSGETKTATSDAKSPAGRPQRSFGGPSSFSTPQSPANFATWQSCQAFVKTLNEKLGASGGKVSLPTEAQWEYACRAGTTTRYWFGDNAADYSPYAWFRPNSNRTTHPVGQKNPNPWGLYDVHGNVWEWCADWYDKDYYKQSPADDPPGPASGVVNVLRGGGWNDDPMYGTCTFRNRNTPGGASNDQGFRLVYVP